VDGFVQPNIAYVGGTFQEPQIGDTFTILTAVGGVIGMFDDVLDGALGGMIYSFALIHNPNNVQIQLASVGGLLGDYNLDGTVNAADYTVWRNTLGSMNKLAADGNKNGMVEMDDYTLWKNHYGATLGVGSALQAPEPGTATLLIWSLMHVVFRSPRRQCAEAVR
jgi:hypothetical protein